LSKTFSMIKAEWSFGHFQIFFEFKRPSMHANSRNRFFVLGKYACVSGLRR